MPLAENDRTEIQSTIDASIAKLVESLPEKLGGVIDGKLKPITERLDKADATIAQLATKPAPKPKDDAGDDDDDTTLSGLTKEDVLALLKERDEEAAKKTADQKKAQADTQAWLKKNGFGKVVGGPYEQRFAACASDEERQLVLDTINSELKSVGGKPIEKADAGGRGGEDGAPGKITRDELNKMTPHERLVHALKEEDAEKNASAA